VGASLHSARDVVLDKVEVGGGDGPERDAQIANDGNGFEKNFGQKDGRAPIEIDAAGMHLLDESAEEAEIEVLAAPRAAPSAAPCMCGMSVPMARWTVTGI